MMESMVVKPGWLLILVFAIMEEVIWPQCLNVLMSIGSDIIRSHVLAPVFLFAGNDPPIPNTFNEECLELGSIIQGVIGDHANIVPV